MKKFLACACVGLLLAGCGSGGSDKVSKSCVVEEDGTTMEMVLNAEGDTLSSIQINALMPYEYLEVTAEEAKELFTEERMKMLETIIVTSLASEGLSAEDLNPTTELSDKGVEIKMTAEASKMEKMFGGSKLDDSVKDLESQGYTCK